MPCAISALHNSYLARFNVLEVVSLPCHYFGILTPVVSVLFQAVATDVTAHGSRMTKKEMHDGTVM